MVYRYFMLVYNFTTLGLTSANKLNTYITYIHVWSEVGRIYIYLNTICSYSPLLSVYRPIADSGGVHGVWTPLLQGCQFTSSKFPDFRNFDILGKQIFVVRISVINLCARITKPCARFTNPCARFTNLCARINYANPYGLLSRAHGLLIGVHGLVIRTHDLVIRAHGLA